MASYVLILEGNDDEGEQTSWDLIHAPHDEAAVLDAASMVRLDADSEYELTKAYLYRIGDSLTDELNSKIDERQRAARLEEAKRLSDKQELAERALLAELKAKYE